MTEHNIPYFRNLWQENMVDLEYCCDEWEKICTNNLIPDDVNGEIRTAIGLARLLMNQKLKQFKGLIDDSEFNTGEKEVTCSDLEGFWDMVYYEIEKIQKSFNRLNECKNNDWKFVEEISERHIKKVPIKRDISAFNKKKEISKAQALAARQRIAELKKKMAAERREGKDQNKVDILLPNRKELVANTNYGDNLNIAVLNDNTTVIGSNEKRKSNRKISKKSTSDDIIEKSSELNSASKQKSAQKKKHTITNKENVSVDKDFSDFKHTPSKQAKLNEVVSYGSEKSKKKPENFVQLQCVTRSAAKKTLSQQNLMQI